VFIHSVIFTEPLTTRKNNYVIMFVSDIRRVCGCQWLCKDSWNSEGRQNRTIPLTDWILSKYDGVHKHTIMLSKHKMSINTRLCCRNAKWVLTIILILCFDNIIVCLCTPSYLLQVYTGFHFIPSSCKFRQQNCMFISLHYHYFFAFNV
jgi:hypothetical protein